MRLFYSPTSPFARKCRIVIREKGLLDRVEEVASDPYANPPELVAANPIVQVPALIADDGVDYVDSPLICAYLDDLGGGHRLTPASGPAHWRVRRLETLADAALEMGVKLTLEGRRPEHERSPTWLTRWREGLDRGLDVLEREIPASAELHLGLISIVCLVTWLDLRHPGVNWREGRPRIVALQAALEKRDSFQATKPA